MRRNAVHPTLDRMPTPHPLRVLVAGATGYVGSRLVPRLLADGHDVMVGARDVDAVAAYPWSDRVERRRFDVQDRAAVRAAMEGVDALVYLVHSLTSSDFVDLDHDAAYRVGAAAQDAGVGRIVYLSGLVPDGEQLSDHLRSRLEVEEVFLACAVPTVVLRAAMVVGGGSTSFEVMRRICERLPVTPVPGYLGHLVQPVAIADVLAVFSAVLGRKPENRGYDLGGPERLSYADLLAVHADVAGLRRPQLRLPIGPSALTARAIALLTGMQRETITALVDSLEHDMVCSEQDVLGLMPEGFAFMPLREAIARSLGEPQSCDGTGDPQRTAPTD